MIMKACAGWAYCAPSSNTLDGKAARSTSYKMLADLVIDKGFPNFAIDIKVQSRLAVRAVTFFDQF
ncbi:hypothetical protein MY3296_000250 [Beauveria thailandica]